MRVRVVTALLGWILLFGLIGLGGPWLFWLFIVILTLGGLWEYFSLAFPNRWKERTTGLVLGLLATLAVMLPLPNPGGYLALLLVGTFSFYLFFGGRLEERYQHLGWTVLGVIYVGYLFPHYGLIFNSLHGREWILFGLMVVMAGDTAAYIMGTALGRTRLWPEISPGKTVVGAVSSVIVAVGVGWCAAIFFSLNLLWWEAILLSLTLNILGQLGDLFESWIKRVFGAKDSGRLLPGHGGLLDRMDSLIFPGVFLTYYLKLLQP